MTGLMATAPFSTSSASPAASGWLVAGVLAAALASAGLLLWAVGNPLFAASFLAGLIGLGAVLLLVAMPSGQIIGRYPLRPQ